MILQVTYMSGAGNLFSVLDCRKTKFTGTELAKLAVLLCNTNQFNGIRTEGLLAMNYSSQPNADFAVDFHNPDGSCGMMCGNGGRCAIRFAIKNGFTQKENISFSLADTIYTGKSGDLIDINFPPPSLVEPDRAVQIGDMRIIGDFITVGTEHFVTKINVASVDEFRKMNIEDIGRQIRSHDDFAPSGTNANFYIEWNGKLLVRTFERGVEAETGACGTGAIATVLSHSLRNRAKQRTEIIPSSGLPLWVSINRTDGSIESITLSGHAEVIGSQEINLPDNFMEL